MIDAIGPAIMIGCGVFAGLLYYTAEPAEKTVIYHGSGDGWSEWIARQLAYDRFLNAVRVICCAIVAIGAGAVFAVLVANL
jgi:hypothetical protein